ncbi:MAG: glycosyltransferase family 2 protein [Chitinophagaceae bacterium]
MLFWQYIFIISCFIIFYNYAGYAIIIYFINALKTANKTTQKTKEYFPSVSFIVAAYNEEDVIEKKILNSLEQNYPSKQIEFIFITDGSTDKTAEIISRFSSIQLMHQQERKGKSAAMNRAVQNAKHEIIIFSDANTILNKDAVQNIARHYIDDTVGGVAGEKKIMHLFAGANEVGAGEGLYWKYESFLKKTDSNFYSVVGAAGELFSVRKKLYEPMPNSVILDDFVTSLKVAQKGYRIIYEPDAYATEMPSFSLMDEQKRKVRIAAGGFQAIGMLGSLFFFWKNFKLSFLYISHRVLRWTLTPLCLIFAFLSNLILCFTNNYWYKIFFAIQICFYLIAVIAKFISFNNRWLKIVKLPYYFVFMNVSVVQGFFRFIQKKQPATWEKVKRS